jgi:hypothetical protein
LIATSRAQQSAAFLRQPALHFNLLVKPGARQLRQHGCIILIGLIVHLTEHRVRLARINADCVTSAPTGII